MPVNLLNEKDLNNYLADIVYHGQETEVFKSGDFKSTAFVEQNKDAIVRSMLLQWCKHRLRSYLAEDLPENREFLTPVIDEPNLPTWAEHCLAEGNPVHRFEADKIPSELTDNIGMIRDYLYAAAESYVNKTLARVKDTNAKGKEEVSPKLRIDYLKTQEAYDTFDKTLNEAQKWHEIMAQKAETRQRNEQMYQASLSGTQSVMKMSDGMEVVQLTTPEALDFESAYMGHCVGNGGYDKDVTNGSTKIYSLRDADGMPHATLEVRINEDTGEEEIHQCKGKGNKAPVDKYRPYIQEFVRQMNFELEGDKKYIGLIKQDGEYYDVLHLPKKFVVEGDLDLSGRNLTELPDLSEVVVKGNFRCSDNQLTSLKGAPKEVGGSFECGKNNLTSLIGAPKKVNGSFWCCKNELTSLEGGPEEVTKHFVCSDNLLTSLQYGPRVVGGDYECDYNNLENLVGAPQKIGRDFICYHCRDTLTSLKGAPQEVGRNFNCSNNMLTSLEGGPKVVGNDFNYEENSLITLEGAPQAVNGHFCCDANSLESLKGSPTEVGGNFNCADNALNTLKGAPQKVGRSFYCNRNHLTSLEGAPQFVGSSIDCRFNQLTTLKGAPQTIGGYFDCNGNWLTSLKYIPVCRNIRSDIDTLYDPSVAKCEFSSFLSYDDLEKSPRFKKEKQEVLDEKRSVIRYKIKRNEAAKNVSPIKGEIKEKRVGKDKIAAKINIAVAKIKQAFKQKG